MDATLHHAHDDIHIVRYETDSDIHAQVSVENPEGVELLARATEATDGSREMSIDLTVHLSFVDTEAVHWRLSLRAWRKFARAVEALIRTEREP